MKPAAKASGDKIYEYLLIYVDDCWSLQSIQKLL